MRQMRAVGEASTMPSYMAVVKSPWPAPEVPESDVTAFVLRHAGAPALIDGASGLAELRRAGGRGRGGARARRAARARRRTAAGAARPGRGRAAAPVERHSGPAQAR